MSKRLQTIVQAIEKTRVLCDVGCDHGYIGQGALEQGRAEQVIFTDISKPSLKKAEQLMQGKGRAQFVCCDGLQGVEHADTVVIAGMGGLEIIQILHSATFKPQRLVLQPMRNQKEVRNFLQQKGYFLQQDVVFFDKKFYTLIVAKVGQESLSHSQLVFGKSNVKNPQVDFLHYIQKEYKKTKQLLSQKEDNQKARDYLELLEQTFCAEQLDPIH